MSYQLFAELTLEQQEAVSGGTGELIDLINTTYKEIGLELSADVVSTKKGSFVKQQLNYNVIATDAYKYVKFLPSWS